MSIGLDIGGLNLDEPDALDNEEWASFSVAHGTPQGYPEGAPAYRFWREVGRPGAIKRQRMLLKTTLPEPEADEDKSEVAGRVGAHAATPNWPSFTPGFIADLHLYLIMDFQLGLEYETFIAARAGYTKEEVLDVFSVANLRSCSRGFSGAAFNETVLDRLRDYPEPKERVVHPEGWEFDPDSFRSGVDFSTLDVKSGEIDLISDWYNTVLGEVPNWVRFLARENPRLLKQMRNRFEHSLKALPKQFMPFLLLNHSIATGASDETLRENLLFARGFGVRRDQAVGVIGFAAATYGGPDSLNSIERVGRTILDNW